MIHVVLNGIGKAYKRFLDVPFVIDEALKLRRQLYGCIGLMAVAETIYLMWKNKIYKSLKMVLCLVLIGMYPLAANSMQLMGAAGVSTLMLYGAVTPTLLVQRFCDSAREECTMRHV